MPKYTELQITLNGKEWVEILSMGVKTGLYHNQDHIEIEMDLGKGLAFLSLLSQAISKVYASEQRYVEIMPKEAQTGG